MRLHRIFRCWKTGMAAQQTGMAAQPDTQRQTGQTRKRSSPEFGILFTIVARQFYRLPYLSSFS